MSSSVTPPPSQESSPKKKRSRMNSPNPESEDLQPDSLEMLLDDWDNGTERSLPEKSSYFQCGHHDNSYLVAGGEVERLDKGQSPTTHWKVAFC